MKSISLFYGGEQPWQEQFCRIHQHEQKNFSLVSLIEPYHDHADSETDTATPGDDDDIASLASCSFESVQPSSLCLPGLPPVWARLFPAGDGSHSRPCELLRSSVSFDVLHLESIFDDIGVSGQLVDEMLALERDTFQRCLSAQPAPTALQRFNRSKCALLQR